MIPRPETELLVELAINTVNSTHPQNCMIADIGTGCGNIAIALAANLPQTKIYATEISKEALEIAEHNIQKHALEGRITLCQGNLLEPLPEPVQLIVANLPYIRESEISGLMPEISLFEPKVALDGGKNGLRYIEELLSQAEAKLVDDGVILMEIGYDQGKEVSMLAHNYLPKSVVSITPDLSGLDRVVTITKH